MRSAIERINLSAILCTWNMRKGKLDLKDSASVIA